MNPESKDKKLIHSLEKEKYRKRKKKKDKREIFLK